MSKWHLVAAPRFSILKTMAVLFLGLRLVMPVAYGQQGRATLFGNVYDASGAAVAEAIVVITNVETNLDYTAVTGDAGYYIINDLPVGRYKVAVTKEGFKKGIRSGLTLEVDQKAQVDVRLEIGAVSETLEVIAETPLVDTGSATVGKVIENRPVQELPVDGRSALALVLLSPAAQSAFGPTASGFADRGLQVSGIRINGSPIAANNLVVDGLSSVNPYVPDVNINPTVEAVQEFKVQTNTMSAEFGFTLGGVVNLVTKAGTNEFHGSLYEFIRNNALDANSWANNRADRPRLPLRYNHFGGAIGGPIRFPEKIFGPLGYNGRNRSFFFFNYDGYRYVTNSSGFYTMPTEAYRRGDFSQLRDGQGNLVRLFDPATTRPNPSGSGFIRDPFPDNIIPQDRIDPVARNIMAFYPRPNRAPDNPVTDLNNYYGAVTANRQMDQYTARFDHRFSERNNFSTRYVYYRQFTDNGTSNRYPDPVVRQRLDPFRGHNVVFSDMQVLKPNLIHDIRFGVARQIFDFSAASAGGDWPQKLGLPPVVPPDTFPAINNGLPGFNTGTVGRRGGLVWQLFDGLTWIRGNHSLKFGTQMRLIQANNLQKSAPSGSFNFTNNMTSSAVGSQTGTGNGFASFLLGAVSSASVTTHLGESEVGKSYSFYIQDDWKPRRRLVLNLGLRYDYQQVPYERRCGTSRFNPFAVNPTNGLLGRTEYACLDYGRSAVEERKLDFAPRFGFALDLFGNQKTVLRGGYSIFYPSLWSFYTDNFGSTSGFATTSTLYQASSGNPLLTAFQLRDGFPFPPTPPEGARLGPNLFAISGNAAYQEPQAHTPMSQQWSLSLQHRLRGNWVVDATYTANHGTHLFGGNYDWNQADPARVALFGSRDQINDRIPNPFAGQVPGAFGGETITRLQSFRPYPYVGNIVIRSPRLGNSIYHALLLTLEKRFSSSIRVLTSYTYGKLISDTISNPLSFAGGEGVNTFGYQNSKFNRRGERAEDPSNVPHRFVLSGLFELPFGEGKHWRLNNKFLNSAVSRWQVNTITTVVDGAPLAVRGANNNLADRPNLLRTPALPSDFVDPNPERGVLRFDPAAFVNPPSYTYGNVPRSISRVRNPGAVIIDLSVFKNIPVTERVRLQFRAEAFNVINRTNLGSPNVGFTAGTNGLNANDAFGRITGSRDPRRLQFALRLTY